MRVASTASISRVASASPTSRGGGSVLKVGPRSAGAGPGPACYGKGGTEPTVTDANVVLGRVGHRPLGGAIRLDPERARVAVADLATRLGIADVATMAEGIVRLVVAEMANAIREISIERGYDPARFTLVPFGGAGPMHATHIAADLGMRRVLVPLDPGNLSALGTRARASSSPSISPARRASPTTYATRSSNRTRASTGTRMQVATSRSSISEPR